METAERFNMPIITFIDTAGAYPVLVLKNVVNLKRSQKNLKVMAGLSVPVICNVVGEGGSGGALAIGVGDYVNMLRAQRTQ
ncbi:hypothetical protein O9993_22405 [Vibrio lentus]|nr:hypothetical protein [Vibrio lentus]